MSYDNPTPEQASILADLRGIEDQIRAGTPILAIRAYRERTGASLDEGIRVMKRSRSELDSETQTIVSQSDIDELQEILFETNDADRREVIERILTALRSRP